MSLPTDSRVEFVEPSGNSYEAQFKHLDRIAEEINTLALASVLARSCQLKPLNPSASIAARATRP